jgi:hypothetical protein
MDIVGSGSKAAAGTSSLSETFENYGDLLILHVGAYAVEAFSGVTATYNGVEMTLLAEEDGSYGYSAIFVLLNPEVGSYTIAMDWGVTADAWCSWASVSGAGPNFSMRDVDVSAASDLANTHTNVVDSLPGDLVVMLWGSEFDFTVAEGMTEVLDNAAAYTVAVDVETSVSVSIGGAAKRLNHAAVSVMPGVSGTPVAMSPYYVF